MADLKSIEKVKLEKFLEMGGGYVCDFGFTNYREFFVDSVGIDIFDDKYGFGNSGSKANRMRSFWALESNNVVAKLLNEILDYWKSQLEIGVSGYNPLNQALYDECQRIVSRIASTSNVEEVGALTPNSSDRDFKLLSDSLKKSIESGELEQALDRLHTFIVKYLRVLCNKRGLTYDKSTPLNALIGGYIKYLRDNKLVESEMSMQILKSSIKVLGSFDSVRNNQSFAHDNALLNREESTLIFNHVLSSIRFIKFVEDEIDTNKPVHKINSHVVDMWEREPTAEEIDAAGDAWIQMENDRRRGK